MIGKGSGTGFAGLCMRPHADSDEREDEDCEQDVGERSVAACDQRNQAEPVREEHAQHQHSGGDRKPLRVAEPLGVMGLQRMVDAFVDGVNGAGPALEQRREDHRLEQQVKCRNADPLKHEIRGQGHLLDLGVECRHRNEEE